MARQSGITWPTLRKLQRLAAKLRPAGINLSICAANLEHPAEFFCPSITGLKTPDLSGVLGKCFEWYLGDKPWRRPKLLEPHDSQLSAGELTGGRKR